MLARLLLYFALSTAPATAKRNFERGDGVTSCSSRPGVCDIAPAQGPAKGTSLTVTVPATGEVYLRSVYCRGAKETTETCKATVDHKAGESKAWTGDPPKKVQAHAGVCAPEIPGAVGDCQQGGSGTWVPKEHGITSVADCAGMCERHCPRCQYVSFSQASRACSWFAECSLPLPQEPAGYVTMAVVRGRTDQFHQPVYADATIDATRPKRSAPRAGLQPAQHATQQLLTPQDATQLRDSPLLNDPLARVDALVDARSKGRSRRAQGVVQDINKGIDKDIDGSLAIDIDDPQDAPLQLPGTWHLAREQ